MAETTEQYRARINQLKTSIENEPLIKKMRNDIAEGISKTGNRQADIEVRQDTLEDDFVAVQQDATSASPSGAEVALARAGFNTLDERLTTKEQQVTAQLAQKVDQAEVTAQLAQKVDQAEVTAQLAQKVDQAEVTAQLAQKASKESLGEVNQDLQATKDTIKDIIVTPAEGITEQEIIDARKGKLSLGEKIEDVDNNIEEQRKQIYDHLYRFGNEYVEKTGGFIDGYKTGTTTQTVTKNADHINVNLIYSGGIANYGLVTTEKFDLTNISTLYIDWEQTTNNASSRIAFVASTMQNQPYPVNDAIVIKYGLAKRDLTPLDVSGLTGDHHIGIHGYSDNSSGEINYKIYQIYTDLELIDRRNLDVEVTKINKRFISTVYPVPSEAEGHWAPEILERQGGLGTLEVWVRVRRDTLPILIKPENGAVNLDVLWGDVKTQLSSNVKKINDKEYLFIPSGSVWVYNLTTNQFAITNRLNVQPYHIVILQNQAGVVVGGEVLNWFYSPYKFIEKTIPEGYIKTEHLSNDVINKVGFSVPNSRKMEFDNVVFDSTAKGKGESLRFAFITDTHGEGDRFEAMITHLNIVKKLEDYGKLDFICHGGDIVNGYLENKNDVLKNLNEVTKTLNVKTPTMPLFGNHDDNSYYDTSNPQRENIVTKQEWRNFVIKQIENNVVFDSQEPLSKYYYKDFDKQKIRVVYLDSMDYPIIENTAGSLKWAGFNGWGFGFRQINWLAEDALNFDGKEDWQLLVFTHAGFHVDISNPDVLFPYNSDHVAGVLKSFKIGTSYTGSNTGDWGGTVTSDFVAQGTRDIIGVFNGHIHRDVLVKPEDLDINLISTTRSQPESNGAFDVVTINRDDREVFLTRFGEGEDRTYTY